MRVGQTILGLPRTQEVSAGQQLAAVTALQADAPKKQPVEHQQSETRSRVVAPMLRTPIAWSLFDDRGARASTRALTALRTQRFPHLGILVEDIDDFTCHGVAGVGVRDRRVQSRRCCLTLALRSLGVVHRTELPWREDIHAVARERLIRARCPSQAGCRFAARSMVGATESGGRPHRRWRALGVFRLAAALIVGISALLVTVVALVTVVLWLCVGAFLWLVGAAAAVAKRDGGRRLRRTGLHFMRSGPSRWLVRGARHRFTRAWKRRGSSSIDGA
jgi:hypothetical protein